MIDLEKFQALKEMVVMSEVCSGIIGLKRQGKDCVADCLWCGKRGKMYLYDNIGKGKAGVFCCYSCNEKGDIVKLLAKALRISPGKAMYSIIENSGFSIDKFREESRRADIIEAMVDIEKFEQVTGITTERRRDNELLEIVRKRVRDSESFRKRIIEIIESEKSK